MTNSRLLVVLFATATCLGSIGCTISTTSSDSDKGPSGPPAPSPEVAALYASDLPAPTSDTLRGVWSLTQESADGTVDLRLRIDDSKVIAGAHCVINKDGKSVEITTGQTAESESADLDKKTGSFTPKTNLSFNAVDQGSSCSGRFDAVTWLFAINKTAATFTSDDKTTKINFVKVGD